MRFMIGWVLLCGVFLFGELVETAKNKQEVTFSKNGKRSKDKTKESKKIATADGENDVWYEIKAMRMDKTEAALPGYFYRNSYKTNDRRRGRRRRLQNRRRHHKKRRYRNKAHVAAIENPEQFKFTSKLGAATSKKPQQLNFTTKLMVAEKPKQLNFDTKLNITMPKKPMQPNTTAI